MLFRSNISGSYAILFFIASHFTSITSHIHNWVLFLLWLRLLILSAAICNCPPLFPSNIWDTFQHAVGGMEGEEKRQHCKFENRVHFALIHGPNIPGFYAFQVPLYSIGPCFYHQSHPQLGFVFALAPSLHSFWLFLH